MSKICCLDNSLTVENFLNEKLDLSRSLIKRQKLKRNFLKKEILVKDELDLPLNLLNNGQISPLYSGPEQKIIYQDDIFLVLNKAAGVNGHPLLYSDELNCLSFLRSINLGKYLYGFNSHEKGLLYRLDLVTSGVLVYIKSPELHLAMRNDFNQIAHRKRYWALVQGKFEQLGGHRQSLVATGKNGEKMKVQNETDDTGLFSQSNISSAQYLKEHDLSWVVIDIETGVRHQIRVLLASLGHPILGDTLYGAAAGQRVYLHAREYQINWRGESWQFVAEEDLSFGHYLSGLPGNFTS